MRFRSLMGIASAVIVVSALGMTAVSFADNAGGDPIKNRRDKMKSNGENAKVIGPMLDGSGAFDAAKAGDAAKAISGVGHEFGSEFDEYFPDTAMKGDTHAKPEIWANKDEFKKIAMSLEADAAAAADAAGKGADAFKAAAGKMFGNCKACHEKFRSQ